MAVNIRKFVLSAHSLDQLVVLGTLTPQAARFLEAAVAAGLNILVSGGTQAGKTTLLNCLCAAIPARERVVTCEEVFELRVPLPDVVAMQTRQPNLEGAGAPIAVHHAGHLLPPVAIGRGSHSSWRRQPDGPRPWRCCGLSADRGRALGL